jgi:hypothetical protein
MSNPLVGGILLLSNPVNGEEYYRNELDERQARLMEAIYLAMDMNRDTRVVNREDDLLEGIAKAYLENGLTGDFLKESVKTFCQLERIEDDTRDYEFDFTGKKRDEFPQGGFMWAVGGPTWNFDEMDFRAAICGQWAYYKRDNSPENRLLASLLAELDENRALASESVGRLIAEYQAERRKANRSGTYDKRKPAGSAITAPKADKAAAGGAN